MVLKVSFDQFVKVVQQKIGISEVFLSENCGRSRATAGDPVKNLIVAASIEKPFAAAKAELEQQGALVHPGGWADEADDEFEGAMPFVVAVAYRSEESRPGLWVDATFEDHTESECLRRMYEEMTQHQEVKGVSYESFLELLSPNVVLLSPVALRQFAERNELKEENPH